MVKSKISLKLDKRKVNKNKKIYINKFQFSPQRFYLFLK